MDISKKRLWYVIDVSAKSFLYVYAFGNNWWCKKKEAKKKCPAEYDIYTSHYKRFKALGHNCDIFMFVNIYGGYGKTKIIVFWECSVMILFDVGGSVYCKYET